MADPFDARLIPYLDSLVPERNQVMQEMEAYGREVQFPIVGPAAGYYMYQMARITGARTIFELGSGYGYSTAWFARAVQENGGGQVHHVVWDADLSNRARGYLARLGYADIVQFHVSEAVEALTKTDVQCDIIFNDIDKHGYPESVAEIKRKLKRGGLLFVDNTLWHGAIFEEDNHTPDTEGVRQVSRMLTTDPEFVTTLIPIRDGVMTAWYQPASTAQP